MGGAKAVGHREEVCFEVLFEQCQTGQNGCGVEGCSVGWGQLS